MAHDRSVPVRNEQTDAKILLTQPRSVSQRDGRYKPSLATGSICLPGVILLNHILAKIHSEKSKDLILDTPFWTTQLWCAELQASTACRIQITKSTPLPI
jgi:hypothetical protein